MDMIKVVRWPDSQQCIECCYGEFVDSANGSVGDSAYICHHPWKDEVSESCPHKDAEKCFFCGEEMTEQNHINGKPWCGQCDWESKGEDFFDKADRLFEQENDR